MFKMYLYILLLIINIKLILSSHECDNIINPNNPFICNNITSKEQNNQNNRDYCCYYESIPVNNSFCKTIPNSAFYRENMYENIDGVLYNITCGDQKQFNLLEKCVANGKSNDLNDCKKHSTVLNSCCYTKGNTEINKGCYWLGTKYEGEINWAGVEMECNMSYLKYYLVNLIFIFLIIF